MSESSSSKRPSGIGLYLVGAVLLAVTAMGAWRLVKKQKMAVASETADRNPAADAGPRVEVIRVSEAGGVHTVSLIGEAHPYQEAILYAKVSGYLRDIGVDKGDHVTAGEVLGHIESPETDHQYQAAVADARNKRINADRAKALVARDMISHQDADQAEADAEVAEANVAELAALRSYEILKAPFDGTVTARYADPGALLQNAANSQSSALPLVTVSETGRLRVYVYPAQADAAFIRVGDPAVVTTPERPELRVAARITRLSGELDPRRAPCSLRSISRTREAKSCLAASSRCRSKFAAARRAASRFPAALW
jgi:membrane fusion protein, multidrug efflux system